MVIDESRAKAYQQYDDCMSCPECSELLTGLLAGIHLEEPVLHQPDREKIKEKDMTIDEARVKAHQQFDDCMFCPGCSKLLTGLHTGSPCYTNWIEKKAQQILKESRKRPGKRG